MTRQTDLHSYTVPTTGDGDYDNTFSTYFDNIDSDVPIRDVESNLSNYTPKSGAKFEATDTENEFIGDGSTWNQLQTAGPNPSYDSLSADSLSNTHVFSNQYTDLQSAINDAIDGSTVWVNNQTVTGDTTTISKPISLKSGAPYELDIDEGTFLETALKLDNGGGQLQGVHVEGITFGGGSGSDHGVELVPNTGGTYNDITFERVTALNPGLDGFRINDFFNVRLRDCKVRQASGDGFVYAGPNFTALGRLRFEQCTARESGGWGFVHQDTTNNVIYETPIVNSNDSGGIKIDAGGNNTVVRGGRIEQQNSTAPVGIQVNGQNVTVERGYATGWDTAVEFTAGRGYVDRMTTQNVTTDVHLNGSTQTRIGVPDPVNSSDPPVFFTVNNSGYSPSPVGETLTVAGGQTFPVGDIVGRELYDEQNGQPLWWEPSAGSSGSSGGWVDATGSVVRDL